ncbi:hypothetical protein, partial [Streptomyces sp.]|uniref:hypothetical protein n=1 Tax=Streptomyces sp. TaxID=1931 RepID=UPI00281137F7
MRRQLFRAKGSSFVGRVDGRVFVVGLVEGRTRFAPGEGRGVRLLQGRRVQRAATHPVEVVVLTGGPEGLEVMATRRDELPEAGHGPIEADAGPRQEPSLTAWTPQRSSRPTADSP